MLVLVGFAQLVFWVFAIASMMTGASGKIAKMVAGFLLLNVAAAMAWFNWLTGKRNVWVK
ncbi:hypothetical protein ACFL0S_06670 [Thermodesulfobacteriota bacterium]